MAKNNQPEETLAANVEVTSGLQAFRSVAAGPAAVIDSPFGRPAAAAAPTIARAEVVNKPPKVAAIDSPPSPTRKPTSQPKIAKEPQEQQADEVADRYPAKITLPLTEALYEQSGTLARALNRTRSVRKERITRNSIIRVALQHFLTDFTLPPSRPVNSEADLLEAALRHRKR